MAAKPLPLQPAGTQLALLVEALLDRIFTPGDLKMGAYASPDAGWLLCDGTVYKNEAFPELAKKLGITWGGVAGTSFAVPDFRGRGPIGTGTGTAAGATAHALAQLAGEETHVLTTPEIPAHNHTITDPTHSHQINIGGAGIGTNIASSTGGTLQNPPNGVTAAATGITINNTGGGGAHQNLGPSAAVNFFIKT